MRLAFATLLTVHGLIHLLGFAKAFDLLDLPQLTRTIRPLIGVMWLAAAVLFLFTAGALFIWPRWWWAIGSIAIAVSMLAIVPSWADAKFGALANLIAMAGVIFGFLVDGPASPRAGYERDVERLLAASPAADVLTEANLAHMPTPAQRYLRTSGVVGQPRVRNFRARMHYYKAVADGERPELLAGHSLGEYNALLAAGGREGLFSEQAATEHTRMPGASLEAVTGRLGIGAITFLGLS